MSGLISALLARLRTDAGAFMNYENPGTGKATIILPFSNLTARKQLSLPRNFNAKYVSAFCTSYEATLPDDIVLLLGLNATSDADANDLVPDTHPDSLLHLPTLYVPPNTFLSRQKIADADNPIVRADINSSRGATVAAVGLSGFVAFHEG